MFKSKSCDQIKRGMGDLEAKFEEKGAPALIPFDQQLLSLLQNDDPTVVKRAFTFLLEIIRAEPKNIWDYYNRMLESLKGKMINSDIVTEFVILAMPKGKPKGFLKKSFLFIYLAEEILTHIFYEGCESNNPISTTIGRTIQLLSLLPTF